MEIFTVKPRSVWLMVAMAVSALAVSPAVTVTEAIVPPTFAVTSCASASFVSFSMFAFASSIAFFAACMSSAAVSPLFISKSLSSSAVFAVFTVSAAEEADSRSEITSA